MNIGFIGTGVMGRPIIRHLAKQHSLYIFNRSKESLKNLSDVATITKSIADLANHSDVIFTMVGFPKDVDQIYQQILKFAKKDTICIDLTSSSPSLAQDIWQKGNKLGIHCLDCPVTGGEKGAISGTLTLMVGGKKAIFEKVLPILQLFGKEIYYLGKEGNGQLAKLSNQIAIAGALASLAESLSFAKDHHLDPNIVLKVIDSGAAASYSATQYGPKMLEENFKATFYVKHFLKDLTIAVQESKLDLKVLKIVRRYFKVLTKTSADEGVQAIIKIFESI
jgi:3-hydroxyisobutyrate dehydrogenase